MRGVPSQKLESRDQTTTLIPMMCTCQSPALRMFPAGKDLSFFRAVGSKNISSSSSQHCVIIRDQAAHGVAFENLSWDHNIHGEQLILSIGFQQMLFPMTRVVDKLAICRLSKPFLLHKCASRLASSFHPHQLMSQSNTSGVIDTTTCYTASLLCQNPTHPASPSPQRDQYATWPCNKQSTCTTTGKVFLLYTNGKCCICDQDKPGKNITVASQRYDGTSTLPLGLVLC